MCGIAGIISENDHETGLKLKEMLLSMQHRGPDGVGIMIDNNVEHKMKIDQIDFFSKKGKIGLGHVTFAKIKGHF